MGAYQVILVAVDVFLHGLLDLRGHARRHVVVTIKPGRAQFLQESQHVVFTESHQ